MPSYLVLGCGVGKATADHLARQGDTNRIVLADINQELARKTYDTTLARKTYPQINLEWVKFDATKDLASFPFCDYDVVISALPAKYNLAITKEVIKQGANFCDLGGFIDITWQQKKLHRLAQKEKVSVIPDCGLMPGMGVIIAKKLTYEFDLTAAIVIYVGGLPQKPRPPLYYQRFFNEWRDKIFPALFRL